MLRIKVPKDFDNGLKIGNVIDSGDPNGNYWEFDIFDIPNRIINEMFNVSYINSLSYSVLKFIFKITPKDINHLTKHIKDKTIIIKFFESIINNLPSKAVIEALDCNYREKQKGKNWLIYYNPFQIDMSTLAPSWNKIFKNVRLKSHEILEIYNTFRDYEYFDKNDSGWNFKGKVKDLAQIAVVYAKETNHPIDSEYINKIYSIIKQCKKLEYNKKSLYNEMNSVKKYLEQIDNQNINIQKVKKEFGNLVFN